MHRRQRAAGVGRVPHAACCRLLLPAPMHAPHAQVVNATVLSISSERPDPRIDAWQGQTLSFFFRADFDTPLGDGFELADVHAAVTKLDFCPVDDGNILTMRVRGQLRAPLLAATASGCVQAAVGLTATAAPCVRRCAWRATPRLRARPCGTT